MVEKLQKISWSIATIFLVIIQFSSANITQNNSPVHLTIGTWFNNAKDPLPVSFSLPGIKIEPFYRVYSADLQKIIDPSFPAEGSQMAIWFRITSRLENLNESNKVFIFAYTIDPNGKEGNYHSLIFPIEFNEKEYIKNKNYEGNKGLNIDTTIPGIWEIRYVAFNNQESKRFTNLSDENKLSYIGFETYRVRILSSYEKATINLGIYAIAAAFFATIIGTILGFFLSERATRRREKHERKSAIKSLINEIRHNEDFAKYILNNKKKYLENDVTPFNDFCVLNLELNLSKEYIKEDQLRNKLLDFYSFLKSMNEFLKRLRMPNIPKNKDMEKNILPGAKRINKNSGEIIKSLKKELSLT